MRFGSWMPGPLSWNSRHTNLSFGWTLTFSVLRSPISSIASSALLMTLRKTCSNWCGSASALGVLGSISRSIVMLLTLRSYSRSVSVSSNTFRRSTACFSDLRWRANDSRFCTTRWVRCACLNSLRT